MSDLRRIVFGGLVGYRCEIAVAKLLDVEPSSVRVNSLLLSLEILQLAPRRGEIVCIEAALNLLAPDFYQRIVFATRGIAIKAFPDLLERWT